MKTNCFKKHLGSVLALLFCAAMEIQAQQRTGGGGGGGFGGFGGFGGGNRNNNANSSTSGQYNNNGTVGSAVISVDPVTHNIIVIADKETSEQIGRVVASLDAPEPQVLIKVVFLEVDDSKALDLGVQGDYTGFSKNFSQVMGYVTNYSLQNVTTTTSGGTTTTTPTLLPSGLSPVSQSYNLNHNFGLPQSLPGATGPGGMYQIMGNDFTATLQAIATAGKAQVLSRPSILARDGQMAEIVVGQSVYLPSSVSLTTIGGSASPPPFPPSTEPIRTWASNWTSRRSSARTAWCK